MGNKIVVPPGGSDVRTIEVRASGPITERDIYSIQIGADIYPYVAQPGDIFRNILTGFMASFTEVGSNVVEFNTNDTGTALLISEKVGGTGFTVDTTQNLAPNAPGHLFLVEWDRETLTAKVRNGEFGERIYTVTIDAGITEETEALAAIKVAALAEIKAEEVAQALEAAKPDLSRHVGQELA